MKNNELIYKKTCMVLLQLQQLGLLSGFRSQVVWWNDFLNNHYHQYETIHPRGNTPYERKHLEKIYPKVYKQNSNRKYVAYASKRRF